MALEAIEGNHRLEARLRPPGPERVGLHGRPTLVHTPRTLAHLAVALRTGDLPGTRLVSVTGDVDAPATVELPETATLADALDAVDVSGEFKAACVGGRFGGLTADLDVGVEPAALSAADLGSEGVVDVLADDRCVVEFVGRRTRYAADENCGRCVPCREGTTQLAGLLRDVYDGTYAPDDVVELVRVMETSSICAFGVEAGRPARTAIDAFESEFEAHADGHCPAGSCPERVEVS
jgi:NADH-quinone oxidoreductase subunit F